MGQSVAVVASGKPALIIGSERVSFTGTQTSLKKSTTSKTSLTKHSTKTTSSASLSSKTSTKSSSPTDSASSTSLSSHSPSTEAPGLADPGNETNTSSRASNGAGVIIGATISGIAGLIALIAVVVFFCCKRGRGAASRNGSASVRSASGNFQPLRSNPDDYESAPSPDMALAGNHRSLFTRISAGGPFSPHLQPGDGRNTYHRGGENDFDAWPVAAVAPTSTAHTTDADATVRAASVAPSRRGSVGTSSILSCDGSKRHSYRGVVTNAVAVGAGCNTMGSLLSHTASKKAVYTQISQQSPYDDTFANSPYNNDSSVSTADSVHNSRNDDEDGNRLHPDHVPLSRDFDEYVRGHTDTLDRICEEDDTDGPSSSANQLPSAAVEDVCLPDTNRCDCTPKVDEDCSNSSSSLIEPASAFDDSTLSGTKRGSSGVLPIDQHMHSNQLQSSLGLRGGDSSGSGSPEVGEPSSSTKASIAAGHSIVGVVGHRGSVIDCCDDRPALHLTTPLLPLDVDSVRPPAVVLVNGDDALPPPVSPPMRPLWQQNRQKSRKLRS
ncbi:hypothetical protein SEPCBS119000_000787 [Sporothrix epigloea]|uniref:Uncharacterized protein n=1 Tax=Sporothrix epigloea TaxID=1892477 RepID=A0ABP0D739_9PEZI